MCVATAIVLSSEHHCVNLPCKITQCVVVDVGHQAERKGLLRVIQEDGVLRRHCKHHPVRQLEYIWKSLDGTVCE